MIFVHVETGLQIVVHEKTDDREYTLASGEVRKVVVTKWLETESGQRCTAATQDDFHNLQQVDVWTERGKVKIQRISQ
jgi:hypothetical protein